MQCKAPNSLGIMQDGVMSSHNKKKCQIDTKKLHCNKKRTFKDDLYVINLQYCLLIHNIVHTVNDGLEFAVN